MRTKQNLKQYGNRCGLVIVTLMATQAHAAVSLARGSETHLTGSLGDVQVNYVVDTVQLTGHLDSTGLVTTAPSPIDATRIQYDLYNMPGNQSVFEFSVYYTPGTQVIGATDAEGFYDGSGNLQTYWGGLAYTELFDSGYGVYDYDGIYGSEWQIDYQVDHVTWTQIGNGFFEDTASGLTNYGFNPTFALYFTPGTQLGLRDAKAVGFSSSASGQVLSAVPVPAAAWLFGSSLLGLSALTRRRSNA